MLFGRLAQLVEHPLDVREVTGSSPVSSTRATFRNHLVSGRFLFYHCIKGLPRNSAAGPFLMVPYSICNTTPRPSRAAVSTAMRAATTLF